MRIPGAAMPLLVLALGSTGCSRFEGEPDAATDASTWDGAGAAPDPSALDDFETGAIGSACAGWTPVGVTTRRMTGDAKTGSGFCRVCVNRPNGSMSRTLEQAILAGSSELDVWVRGADGVPIHDIHARFGVVDPKDANVVYYGENLADGHVGWIEVQAVKATPAGQKAILSVFGPTSAAGECFDLDDVSFTVH